MQSSICPLELEYLSLYSWPLLWFLVPWRRERLPTPIFWPGEFHELYSPWGCNESDMTERLALYLSLVPSAQNTCPACTGHSLPSSSCGLEDSKPTIFQLTAILVAWVLNGFFWCQVKVCFLGASLRQKKLPIGAYFEYSVLIYTKIIIFWFHLVRQWLFPLFSPPCFGSTLLLSGFINPRWRISHRICFFTPCEWKAFNQFSCSVMSTSATPWTAACQASLSFTISQSLLKFMSIESVVTSKHLILCRSLLLPPSIFPSIRVFSNKSVLRIGWPKYWSFSFSISPSNEYSGLISFRMDWLDLLVVQGTLKSLLTPWFKSINSLVLSFIYSPTFTSIHEYWKNHHFD